MAELIVDQHYEYVWQVPDPIWNQVTDYVLRHTDSASAFYDLLYASKTYGRLEFFQLGDLQRQQFESLVTDYYGEQNAKPDVETDDVKKVKQLIDLIDFAKGF